MEKKILFEEHPILAEMSREEEVLWINPDKQPFEAVKNTLELTMADVDDAEARLARFAPFIMRCFPETRDKMKLELKKLGIPFYDPMLIIEKTQGRMAEDEFSIRIERKNA